MYLYGGKTMKILHLIGCGLGSGAGRGAYWLHKGLLELGVDSHVLTSSKETYGDKTVTSITSDTKGKLLTVARGRADASINRLYRKRQRVTFSPGLFGHDFTRTDEYKETDIVHLHWVCGGLVNVRHLAKVDKPIIWTVRDMWPMTGGCHYSMDCDEYLSSCGRCPQLGSRQIYDLSSYGLRRKSRYVPRTTILVGISHWLSECARRSALFQGFDVRTIHNNVSTVEFFPVDKATAREVLGLPQNRRIILAGAQNLNSVYKGFGKYLEALRDIPPEHLLLFFGKLDSATVADLGRDYVSLGFLKDTVSLRLAYSAADVFVAPSLMEAFGKTLAESLACGTPVVCFDATGPQDIVTHKIDGYKAIPFEASDLASGIGWILDHPAPQEIARNARQKVLDNFETNRVAGQYLALYREVPNSAL